MKRLRTEQWREQGPDGRRGAPAPPAGLRRRTSLAWMGALGAAGASGAVAGALVGCGPSQTPGGSSPAAQGTQGAQGAPLGQATLKVGATFAPGSLDTLVDTITALRVGLAEQLFRQRKDVKPEPWLASGAKQLDERTWEIGLRPGVKFSDGEAVDAAAVKAALDRAIERGARARALFKFDAIDVKDAATIRIVTQAPNAPLPAMLTDPSSTIFSVRAADAMGEAWATKPVMTGPFVVERHTAGNETVVVRNPNYWGPPARLARMVYTGMIDNNSRVLALQAGDIDIAQTIAATSVPVIQRDPRFVVKEVSSLRVHKVFVNHAREAWKDLRVRQALAHAIDREALVKTGMQGGAIAATGAIPPAAWPCRDIKGFAFDAAKSKQLLAAAGYRDADSDGVVEKDGRPLQATILTFKARAELPVFAEIMQAQFKAVGIRSTIRVVDDIEDALKGTDWDLATSSTQTMQGGDPLLLFAEYMHSAGRFNSGGYRNSALDRVVDQAGTAPSERREQLICEASKIATEDVAFLWLVYPKLYYGISKDVSYEPHPNDFYFIEGTVDKKGK